MKYEQEHISKLRPAADAQGIQQGRLFDSIIDEEMDQEFYDALTGENAELQLEIGYKYMEKRNYAKAFFLFKRVSEQGHPGAQVLLGVMYNNGYGINKDNNEAFRLFSLAADQGRASGQTHLGKMYLTGTKRVKKDVKKAFELFKLAEVGKDLDGTYQLAIMYEEGINNFLPQDKDRAIALLEFPAKYGHQLAISKLKDLKDSRDSREVLKKKLMSLQALKKETKAQTDQAETQQEPAAQAEKLEPSAVGGQKKPKKKQEGDGEEDQESEKTHESRLLVDVLLNKKHLMKLELESVKQEVKKLESEKQKLQDEILANIKTTTEKLKEELDANGQKRRPEQLKKNLFIVNEMRTLYGDIKVDTEHLLLLLQLYDKLQGPLSSSEKTQLEAQIKILYLSQPSFRY